MACARTRPSACPSVTVSTSCTALIRVAMIATASSTDISGPPKAKQSSDNCAMSLVRSCSVPQHVFDIDRRGLHHSGDGRDVIEMGDRKPGRNIDVAGDTD